MLEAQALQCIRKFDIDAEVVRIELQLVAFEQAAVLVHVHGKRRHVTIDGQFPVLVARWLGLKTYTSQAVSQLSSVLGHPWIPVFGGFVTCTIVHLQAESSGFFE